VVLVIGYWWYWLLVIGYWLVILGYWLLELVIGVGYTAGILQMIDGME